VRYEDYDEFGDTTDWKVSGRYQFTDAFAVRATANTGFRAPTPGQVHTLNTTTTANSAGELVPSGTYPVSSPVGIALGAVPLEPEESDAYTVGLVWDAGNRLSFTLDFYHIEIDERLALRSDTVDQAAVDQLIAAGIPTAEANLLLGSAASFFVNGFDSEIEGIDLAATAAFDVGGGDLLVDFRHNYNTQTVSDVDTATINDARVYDLENQIPENRSVLSFDWDSGGMLGALLRLNYYDGWSSSGGLFDLTPANEPLITYDYGSTLLVDAEVSMTFNDMFTVTIGGENIFDEYPDNEGNDILQALGDTYAVTSPYGFNGGFYYLRLSASF
jgi:iron complex outermembrane receptor protein